MQTARNILKRKLLSLLILVLAMISTVVKGFKKFAPIHAKNVLAIARPVSAVREFSYERSRSRSSGGGRGRGGSRGGSRAPDPFASLNFQKTINIDPDFKTPITEANLSPETLKVLQAKGFTEMTPVQSQAFTEIFSGKDVVARSRTGTGKTLAFGLPIIERLIADGVPSTARRGDLPVVLILEPTRELAIQVAQELEVILRPHRMRVEAIYGGSSFGAQHDALRRGVHILVGTPGRMLDHISRGTVNLGNVKHVVLDEGDTMLEMGFQKDVETILMSVKSPGDKARDMATKSLAAMDENEVGDFARQEEEWFDHFADEASRPDRVQMLLFSATMPGWICKLTDKMMQDPIFLDAVQEGETRLANTIKHVAISLPAYTSPQGRAQCIGQLLEDIIMVQGQGGQCIVFTNFKDDCDYLVGSDTFSRLRAAALHGDISQNQRTETIRSFKEKRLDVLVATDVAARGLDIAGVDLVVHCALPNDVDSYVHRSGRTGRAGRPGTSVLLYNSHEDVSKMSDYQRKLMFQYTYSSLPTPNEVVESYVTSMNNKIEGVSNSVCKYFLPHAQAFLAKARKGELLPQDEVVDVTDEAVAVEGDSAAPVPAATSAPAPVADQTEELVARLMAALSNRQSFSTRSLITGEPDRTTLVVRVLPKSGVPPASIREFQQLFEIFLNKKLNITDFKYRKGVIGELNRSETRGDEDRTLFVQDFDPDVAEEILEKMKSVTVIGLTVKRCEVLPKLRLRDFSSSRGGDRGDRNSFSRGGDRYNDRRSGSSRGGYERGEDRFSTSRSRSYDDAAPRRSWQSGR